MIKIDWEKFAADYCFFGWYLVETVIIVSPDGKPYRWQRQHTKRFKPLAKKTRGVVIENDFYIWYE
jgi:hypothetical protein